MRPHHEGDDFVYGGIDVDPGVLLDNLIFLFSAWEDADPGDDDHPTETAVMRVYDAGRKHAIQMCIRSLRQVLYAKAPLTGEQFASIIEEAMPARRIETTLVDSDELTPDVILKHLENLVVIAKHEAKETRERLAKARRLHAKTKKKPPKKRKVVPHTKKKSRRKTRRR